MGKYTVYASCICCVPENDKYAGVISLKDKGCRQQFEGGLLVSRKEAAKFAGVKGNQNITVKSVFNAESGAILRFCKLVEIE